MLHKKYDIQLHFKLMEGNDSAAVKTSGRKGLNSLFLDLCKRVLKFLKQYMNTSFRYQCFMLQSHFSSLALCYITQQYNRIIASY